MLGLTIYLFFQRGSRIFTKMQALEKVDIEFAQYLIHFESS